MMPAVLTRRISRHHRKIRRFGDGWQSGFAKSALPVSGRIEAIKSAERLSVTPPFEDLGAHTQASKGGKASADAAFPPRRAHGTLQPSGMKVS